MSDQKGLWDAAPVHPTAAPGRVSGATAALRPVRLSTWNINSIRARLDRLVAWIARSDVDIVAIQETKIPDDKFPVGAFADLGYQVAHHGTSQWNGVAIASRVGIDDVRAGFPGMPPWGEPPAAEARAISAVCAGIEVWSVYVPNGRAVLDPHFAYKLAWLEALRQYGSDSLAAHPDAQIAICGDFNIAPTDDDV